MALTFYADTHIAKAIAEQLRANGVDIVRCEEVKMAESSDEAHLEYATQAGRVMITQDADFAMLHRRWQESGRQHRGIVRVPPDLQGEAQIGFVVRELLFYHDAELAGALDVLADIANQLIYL
ncbi:MAG: DUF5615 family PIN-like protein [Anaerolineae bacterium]